MANRLKLEFNGLLEYAELLDRAGKDLKKATEKALQESAECVHKNLHLDMKRHRRTGSTEKSIRDDAKVEWDGTVASVDVGFGIRAGGVASIFLMYGTPRLPKDSKLYNDVYGKGKIQQIQKRVFEQTI